MDTDEGKRADGIHFARHDGAARLEFGRRPFGLASSYTLRAMSVIMFPVPLAQAGLRGSP